MMIDSIVNTVSTPYQTSGVCHTCDTCAAQETDCAENNEQAWDTFAECDDARVEPDPHASVQQRVRLVWNAHQPPRCFDSRAQWREWFALRSGVYGPCVDCTPEFRARMGEQCRCERPEVIFVRDARSGEVSGLSGEDPRYARVLLGLALAPGVQIIGRTIAYTESWQRLLKKVRRRAHRDVQWAIDVWHKRYRAHHAKAVRRQDKGAEE